VSLPSLDLSPASLSADSQRLLELLTERSFARKKVVLSSGKESDFYIDCKKTILSAEGHWLMGKLLLAKIREKAPEVRAVGGLTMGADPIASAVSLLSHLAPPALDAFLVRKEPKGHGSGQWVEGLASLPKGSKVAIVEDVVTTGASTLKAIGRARDEGLEPVGAFALVDRLEGGKEAIEASGVPVHALFSRKDFP
jgi:orotate phosphoribosyltransferase